eukprot:UN01358
MRLNGLLQDPADLKTLWDHCNDAGELPKRSFTYNDLFMVEDNGEETGAGGADGKNNDSCVYHNDGTCDEGSYCDPGTDCTDCNNCDGEAGGSKDKEGWKASNVDNNKDR